MKFTDVTYANFSNIAYLNWEGIRSGLDIKDALFDVRKKNTKKLHSRSAHLFMVYSEDPVNETPLWDRQFDGWDFVYAANASKLASDMGIHNIPDNGFYACAFRKGRDVLISFRGTNDINDVLTDLTLVRGKVSLQLVYAYLFTKYIKDTFKPTKLHLTGHSLGGALAQAIMNTELSSYVESAVTFNAFGIKELLDEIYEQSSDSGLLNRIIGYLGLYNPGTIVSELEKISPVVPGHKSKHNLTPLYSITVTDVKAAIIKAHNDFIRGAGMINVTSEKEVSVMGKPLKVQFGFGASMKHAERVEEERQAKHTMFKEDMKGNAIEGLNYKSHIIAFLLEFLNSRAKSDSYRNNITNFIFKGDLVATAQSHLGKVIAVDESNDKMRSLSIPNKMFPQVVSKKITRLHSVGNFFMFLADDGNFVNAVRFPVLANAFKDYVLSQVGSSDPVIETAINTRKGNRRILDLILKLPHIMASDEWPVIRFIFGYRYIYDIMKLAIDTKGNVLKLGAYANIKHDGLDYTEDILDIKIV